MVTDAGLENTGQDQEECEAADNGDGFSERHQRAAGASDTPDPRKLAQDWITLWQSELSAMAADPEIRESWQTFLALWAGTISTILRGMPREQNAWSYDSARGRAGNDSRRGRGDDDARGRAGDDDARGRAGDDKACGRAGPAEATRAAPFAAAPDARDAEIERLARHVAALERRLAELERGGDPPRHPKVRPGPGSGRKPRR